MAFDLSRATPVKPRSDEPTSPPVAPATAAPQSQPQPAPARAQFDLSRARPVLSSASPVQSKLLQSNPSEYDPASPEYQVKYGRGPIWESIKVGLREAPAAVKATLLGILQGATFNLGDEMAAGASMAEERDLPLSQQTIHSPEEYQARNQQVLDASRRQLAESAKEHPYLTTAGSLIGGTALGGSLAEGGLTLAGQATTIPQAILYGGAEGAAYGAAYGAGAGNSPRERLTGAAKGAAFGGGTGAVTGGIAGYAASKGIKLPTTDELHDKSQVAYKTAEKAGVILTPQASSDLADKVDAALQVANVHPKIHGATYAALQDLKQRAKNGLGMTLSQLDQARQLFADAAKTDPANAPANIAKAAINNAVDTLTGSQLQSGNAPVAIEALKQARGLWRQYSHAQTLDDVMNIADVTANQYSISGRENAVRQGFSNLYKSLVRDKAEAATWSPGEIQAIKNVAMGTNTGKALRLLGKFAFRGPIGGSATVGGYIVGGPLGAGAVAAAGEAGRYGALASRLRNADIAQQIIRTGQRVPITIEPVTSAINAGLGAAMNQQTNPVPQLPPGAGVRTQDAISSIMDANRTYGALSALSYLRRRPQQ